MDVVVLDFETTGLSCDRHRVIEIGAVILNGKGEIVDTFQTLCNPPLIKKLPKFITKLTGITDDMLIGQPSTATAMESLYVFIGNRPIIAHNATFDSKFLIAEMRRIDKVIFNQFLCSLLLSRRLLQTAQCYKLSSLKKFINFESTVGHKDHRALDDVLVTVALWRCLMNRLPHLNGIADEYAINLLSTISRLPKKDVTSFLEERVHETTSGGGIITRLNQPKRKAPVEAKVIASIFPPSGTMHGYYFKKSTPLVFVPVDDEVKTEDYPPLDMAIIVHEFVTSEIIAVAATSTDAVLVHETFLNLSPICLKEKRKHEKRIVTDVPKRRSLRHSNPF